ncbi:Uncharacterized protein TCM_018675 [Theobroma cacao]|uniref:Uncharacterized protein n=1 Tax=Theobroma cacao TaxID=3641 RepID=A0A061EF58_THECC|nr:Uncharacterized protein TCM_018675 [Theobroma cacao]
MEVAMVHGPWKGDQCNKTPIWRTIWLDLATTVPDQHFPAIGSGHGVLDSTVRFGREAPDSVLFAARSGWISIEYISCLIE